MRNEKVIKKNLIDLDGQESFILTITHNGQVRSLTKSELLKLLDLSQNIPFKASNLASERLNGLTHTRTLASVGNRISRYLHDLQANPKSKDKNDEFRLIKILKEFDGLVKDRATSEIYPNIQELLKLNISGNLRDELNDFLSKYPTIAKIKKGNT